MKYVKPILAVLLIPFIYAMARLLGDLTVVAWVDLASRELVLWTLYGAGFWTALFLVFHPPMGVYVVGHELTHAGFAWMQGVKVISMRLHSRGGQVEVERTNWLITLAPYFFPLYCLLILLLFVVCNRFLEIRGLTQFWMFLIGMSWAFHITFTVQMLTLRQSDIEREGILFSASIILLFNLLAVVCWAICIADPPWSEVFFGYGNHLKAWLSIFG